MNAPEKLTIKDFSTDQEVRWCPGCGDYAILKTVQKLMPELDQPKENTVFVSGIGCHHASRITWKPLAFIRFMDVLQVSRLE